MALSESGASLITGGINAVGSYFASRGVSKAQKDAIKAQQRLVDLQAEEQRIRNQALRASLSEQNHTLPFAVSNPSLETGAFAGNVQPSGMKATEPVRAGGGPLVIGLALAALVGLALTRARAV